MPESEATEQAMIAFDGCELKGVADFPALDDWEVEGVSFIAMEGGKIVLTMDKHRSRIVGARTPAAWVKKGMPCSWITQVHVAEGAVRVQPMLCGRNNKDVVVGPLHYLDNGDGFARVRFDCPGAKFDVVRACLLVYNMNPDKAKLLVSKGTVLAGNPSTLPPAGAPQAPGKVPTTSEPHLFARLDKMDERITEIALRGSQPRQLNATLSRAQRR